MSGPTHPEGPENATPASDNMQAQPGAATQADQAHGSQAASPGAAEGPEAMGSPASGDAPARPQAYVDPSIAAEAQLVGLERERDELKDRLLRAHAEMDNLRKRTEREKADTAKYAISKFAGDMIAVADNLSRALEAFTTAGEDPPPQVKALLEGVELTEADLNKALERHGVRKIEAAGALFDPNFHQAVMEEENKEVAAGTIVKVFQEGYSIGERVLRPSMVVVARGGFKPAKPATDATPSAANDASPDTAPGDADGEPSAESGGAVG